jgi:hypothetical protein
MNTDSMNNKLLVARKDSMHHLLQADALETIDRSCGVTWLGHQYHENYPIWESDILATSRVSGVCSCSAFQGLKPKMGISGREKDRIDSMVQLVINLHQRNL